MPNLATATANGHLIEPIFAGEPDEQVCQEAMTTREPDHQVVTEDLARWVGVQERIELRAELAASNLL